MDKPLQSVTHYQCDARPTVTFPAAGHHRRLTGSKLYCLVTEAGTCVWTTCPRLLAESAKPGVEPATSESNERGRWVWTTCPGLLAESARPEVEPAIFGVASPSPNHYATIPHSFSGHMIFFAKIPNTLGNSRVCISRARYWTKPPSGSEVLLLVVYSAISLIKKTRVLTKAVNWPSGTNGNAENRTWMVW